MPQSFINTGGFSSPVMPGFQLANPALFNVGTPLLGGINAGVGIGADLQRQRQLAAMAPMELERARLDNARLAALTPLQIQEARMNLAKASMPIPVEEGFADIPGQERPVAGIGGAWLSADDEAQLKAIEAEQGPEAAAAERARMIGGETTGGEPIQAKQYGLYTVSPETGQMERTAERLVPIESQPQFEERKSLEESRRQLAEYHSQLAQAKDEAAALRQQLIESQKNVNDARAENLRSTGRAAVTRAESGAKRDTAMANKANQNPVDLARSQALIKQAASYGLGTDELAGETYKILSSTGPGRQALLNITNAVETSRKTNLPGVLDDSTQRAIESARTAAKQRMEEAAKPVGVNINFAAPAGGEPSAVEVPAQEAGSIVDPTPEEYARLQPGETYIYQGKTYVKGQK